MYHTYIDAKRKLFAVKHHYPLDVLKFAMIVADLQEANEKWHLMDHSEERSSGDHD